MRLDPWNPMAAVSLCRIVQTAANFTASSDNQQIVPANPNRIYLLIYSEGGTDFGVGLFPFSSPTGGIKPASGTNFVLIHTANMPGLTQQAWNAYAMVGGVLEVWDVCLNS